MAISVARIAVELGIIADDTGTVSAGVNDVLTTYLSAANLHVEACAPNAPEAVKDMAVVRYVAYQYQERGRDRQSRNAFVSSGAEAVLSEYRSPRLAASSGPASGGAATPAAAGGAVGDILTRAAEAMTGAWRNVASILTGIAGDKRPGKVLKLGIGNQPEWADDETADAGSGLDAAAVGAAIRDSPLAGRVTDLEEFEASVRTNTQLFTGNVTQAASNAFQALPGVAWPAAAPDREIIVHIRNSAGSNEGSVTLNLSSIESKGVASLADQASSRNSIRFGVGDEDFSLAFGPSRAIYFAADDIDVYTLTLTDSAITLGRGERGPAGPQGEKGDTGPAGPAGPQGPAGSGGATTDEKIQDVAAGLFTLGDDGGADIAATYDDSAASVSAGLNCVGREAERHWQLNMLSGRAAGKVLSIATGQQQFMGVDLPSGGSSGGADGFVQELGSNQVLGLAITSTQGNKRTALTPFTNALTLGASDHGVILMEVSWTLGPGDDVRIRLGDDTEDQSRQIYLTRLREALQDGGTQYDAGLEIDSIDVYDTALTSQNVRVRGLTPRGKMSLRIAVNSSNQVGFFTAYTTYGTSGAAQSGTVRASVEATLLRTDGLAVPLSLAV